MSPRAWKILPAVALTAVASAAGAAPVTMACNGHTLLPSRAIIRDSLSLTVDESAGFATVGGYEPLQLLPGTGTNEVQFIGDTSSGHLYGSVDRVTGEVGVKFFLKTPREKFFHGKCRPKSPMF